MKMKLCANRETAEALYLMGKQTMYTPIVGDKQGIACRNDDNGVQLLGDSSFETRRDSR